MNCHQTLNMNDFHLQEPVGFVPKIRKPFPFERSESAPSNLQPHFGLTHLTSTVKKVPNKNDLRVTPSLCSLALVFDEIRKTNPHGEPFYLKDLVMVDARFREWKRLLPNIIPSYDISISPDPKILNRLAQAGASFVCDNNHDRQLVASLDIEHVTSKFRTIPTESVDSGVYIYVSSEQDVIQAHQNVPHSKLILRLQSPYFSHGLPLDKAVSVLNTVTELKMELVGVSVHPWNIFSLEELKHCFSVVAAVCDLAERRGVKLNILDIESEIGEHNFEKNAKTISRLIREDEFLSSMEVHLCATEYFTMSSHFLFTKVLHKQWASISGERICEVYVDCPPAPIHVGTSKPAPIKSMKTGESASWTKFYTSDSQTPVYEALFPDLSVGEWIYWTHAGPAAYPVNHSNTHEPKVYHSFRFEGPEKKLELSFRPIPGDVMGLRNLNTPEWQAILDHGHLQILSEKKNDHFDSYLLSESSLFVYPYKVVIKTCGISSPLLCTPSLKEVADKLKTEIESVMFSRRSFICPGAQCFPHRSVDEEADFLNKHFPGGDARQLGDPSSDHWFLYSYRIPGVEVDSTPSFEVTMTGRMDEKALRQFWRDENKDVPLLAEKTGFASLTPGADIDEFAFTPCGYSYNGLKDDGYVTVHITPEQPLCYISFETNITGLNYEHLLKELISTYKPAHFTVLILNNGGKTCKLPGYSATHEDSTLFNDIPVHFERRKKVSTLSHSVHSIHPVLI
eukprot:TRINITY_DN11182_c0_g1_i1.p1 TRINITY_DN11182_c0_g1~~TRINITY_DN11182_c0_g1_i1.p1  ORF type:complete len:737 (+),score=124.00 TRINITY_DN11182_c0_g1_i1:109-2319(+)